MHILHLTPYYAPAYSFGGVVRAVEGLSQALVQRGHEVTVLTTDALSLTQPYSGPMEEVRDGVSVRRVRNALYPLRRLNLSTPIDLRRLTQEILPQVDVVHLHEFRTVENLLVAPLAAQMNKPLVLSPHGTLNRTTGRSHLKTLWDQVLSPRVAQHMDHVVALVQPELDDIQALWRQLNAQATFSIIPNGIDPAQFATRPDPSNFRSRFGLADERIVLFMGRLHERKGVEALLQAFLLADVPATRLVFAGPDEGMLSTLQSLADERVTFTGYLDSEARLEALAAADLFALPAVGEGLSMAALEAMAAGLPVLLSPGCNLPEAATQGAGRIVEPTVEGLSTTLRQMLSGDDLVQMGAKAQQLVHERLTWSKVAAEMEAVYRGLCSFKVQGR